jgi:Domain of unknown function (DUF4387)
MTALRQKRPLARATCAPFSLRVKNYEAALRSNVFSKNNVARILAFPADRVIGTFFVDTCSAIKISIDRLNISASVDERDVFGAQQQSAIECPNIPIYAPARKGIVILTTQHVSQNLQPTRSVTVARCARSAAASATRSGPSANTGSSRLFRKRF